MAAAFGAGDPVAAAADVVELAKHGWSDRQVNFWRRKHFSQKGGKKRKEGSKLTTFTCPTEYNSTIVKTMMATRRGKLCDRSQ
jgi:transposase-like protein